MAFVLTLLVLTGVFGSVEPVAKAPSPPVIREPFTLLPCPAHPRSTIALEGCLEHQLVASDKRINMRVSAIFHVIRTPAMRAIFVESERAWFAYRRASCSVEASVFGRASGRPLAFLHCEEGRNTRHLTDLAETNRALRRH